MRAQLYKDGILRINAKIEIPMSHHDVSEYLIASIENKNQTLEEIQKLNKRELLRAAKREIYDCGVKAPRSKDLQESVDMETSVIIKNYVKNMFPELV
jgi:hypothetical protein|tara:strand:+ start:1701 stop:1994 length:294 start_codon:yes stop_codon:yes gene_type:complete